MISNPKIGRVVQVWYAKPRAGGMPHHGKVGFVRVVAKPQRRGGRSAPRNHVVEFGDGWSAGVPAGNLRNPPDLSLILALFQQAIGRGVHPLALHWQGQTTGSIGVGGIEMLCALVEA